MPSKYSRKIIRILLKTIAFILLFISLIFVLLLTPPVQRFLTAKVQHYLENKLHTRVAIGRISFGLSGRVALHNIYIEDKSHDTLISGGSISARVNLIKLLSQQIHVKDLEVEDVTAKIKRILPDTIYNFQFIADAFSGKSSTPDTTSSTPMQLDINSLSLKNINFSYTDAISGNDLFAHIGELVAHIDTIDASSQHFVIPSISMKNSVARIKQIKPLLEQGPALAQPYEGNTSSSMKLQLSSIDIEKTNLDYGNDVSAVYATADLGQLKIKARSVDLANNKMDLNDFLLDHSSVVVRFGKVQQAKPLKQELKKDTISQAGWNVALDNLELNDNSIQFDDDNKPAQSHGIDYSHLYATHLSLDADHFIMNPDSIAVNVKKGAVNEKSGLVIEQLKGDVLYANNTSYLRDLYIKTPGTEIKNTTVLTYPSLETLTKNLDQSSLQIDLVQSKVQVKDVLLFAPQLSSNAALRNPNDVWTVNLSGSGTTNHFNIQALHFDGLSNTIIDAHGSLTGLTDAKKAGGNFVIERFHTNRNDILLFAGNQLKDQPIDLPAEMSLQGTINGNAGIINTKLNILTSDGNAAISGRFANVTNTSATEYDGILTTSDLKLGKIFRQPNTIGSLTGTMIVHGKGLTTQTIHANFSTAIMSAGYNQYQYSNINLNGSLNKSVFEAKGSIKDPNADAHFLLSGNISDHPAFTINGMIDSLKTQPLHLTSDPLVFRAKIDGDASDISADNPTAHILITQSLFVSGTNRLALDTIEFSSGKNDTADYINLKSSVANANITGQYRIADLGSIVLNSIQPYFNTGVPSTAATKVTGHFNFAVDVQYHPILSSIVPGLTDMKSIHAQGIFNNSVMNVMLTCPYILYQGNAISDMELAAKTTTNGLQITGIVAHIKSGSTIDMYHTQLNALVFQNKINFSLGVDDATQKNKYFVGGKVTQPVAGTYAIQLRPDSLFLNYQRWTVSPGNLITISPSNIIASNFILQNSDQRLSINSPGGQGQQLIAADFSNFRLSTITGFMKADSVLADGLINGNIRLSNFLQQPGFTGDLTITDLSLQKDTIGNVTIHAASSQNNRYNIEAAIKGKGNDALLKGWVANEANSVNLNLDFTARALQLQTIEGLTGGAIKNSSGAIQGNISIRGTTDRPKINGSLNFDKTGFILAALGSPFYIDGQKISVADDGLTFSNFTVKDSSGNTLALNGKILTDNFVNYEFDLKLKTRNFQVLNSAKKDNPLYYGRMNINADLAIKGTEIKPSVDGRITVNDGTALTFVVPQPDQGMASREGIVEFVDMSNPAADTLFKKYDSLNKSSVLGMDVSVNIEIKKEAIFNIVVDPANGDFLNAQGEALLTAGIDPSGKITMTGNYTLEKGAYQISFNLLKRKFEINKGSTITWTGEPTTANLNITATYVANTAPIDLVQDQVASSSVAIRNTYLQKLPFELRLNLTGELMKPAVAFDIVLPADKNYGVSNDVVTTVQYKLSQLRQDEGETNKQVFSLLLLNRFIGENPFASSGGGGGGAGTYIRQSASKLLTEQLNQLAAGLINGVDVDFGVTSTEDYTTGSMRNRSDLNVNVSKQLLNDRLKISVGSNFELEGPKSSNQQSNNIAGNVAADYQLSRDGRYMIRFFRKNDYEGEIDGYVIETGLSFIISIDYNRFSEILHHRRQRATGTEKQKTNAQ